MTEFSPEASSGDRSQGQRSPAVTLRHEAVIAASAQRVWEALVDVRAWPEWNPTLRDSDGPLEVGQWVRMGLQLGPVRLAVRQHVKVVEAPHRLAWRTRNVAEGFMDVDRTFEIEPLAGGGVLLRQGETALGPVVPVAMPLLRRWILFRRLLRMMIDYRDTHGCFTFISLYVKSIDSPYLAQGDPDNQRWVEFLFYVGVDPDRMTDALLDRIADELDQNCIDTGSYRYMHTRTGRDPARLAVIDPNAPHNDGVSLHPADRPFT